MSDIPSITIVKKGCDQFPRFIVAKGDLYRNPIYWDGSDWTNSEAEARVFASVNEASWVHHNAMEQSLQGRPVHRYVAPVYIEVYGEKPKFADLKQWLEKAVRVVVNSPQHGLGPQDTVAMMIFDGEAAEESL